MNKPSQGQVLNAIAILMNNADWGAISSTSLQSFIDNPRAAGSQFTAFLKYGGVEQPKVVVHIDRTSAFDPVAFIGEGWSFAEARNPRSAALGLLDYYSKVKLSTDWLEGKSSVDGETRRTRILVDTASTPLNADHFLDLWNNKEKIPEEWKKVKGVITFDGDVLRDSRGDRYILCLYWSDGRWSWYGHWLGRKWHAAYPSAVLAS
ncbi:MAG: hypothetical protein WCK60_00565 [Candidatus Nomurabacteria bacterium]